MTTDIRFPNEGGFTFNHNGVVYEVKTIAGEGAAARVVVSEKAPEPSELEASE
jgi:hypothetical protein